MKYITHRVGSRVGLIIGVVIIGAGVLCVQRITFGSVSSSSSDLYPNAVRTSSAVLLAPTGPLGGASDTMAPTIPAGLRISEQTSNGIRLNWNASYDTSKEVKYFIYRNDVKIGESNITTYIVPPSSDVNRAWYRVAAQDTAGNLSGLSLEVSVSSQSAGGTVPSDTHSESSTPESFAPSAPTWMTSWQKDDSGAVWLSWGASNPSSAKNEAQKYIVYRDGEKIGESVTTVFSDRSALRNHQYSYYVVAQNAQGTVSGKSSPTSIYVSSVVVPLEGAGMPGYPNVPTSTTSPVTPVKIDDGGVVVKLPPSVSSVTTGQGKAATSVSRGSSSDTGNGSAKVITQDNWRVYTSPTGIKVTLLDTTIVNKDEVKSTTSSSKTQTQSSSSGGQVMVARGVIDQDGDGLSDEEEMRRGTDPGKKDTDGDGFSDGAEVQSGYNPLKYSVGDQADKIQFQSAQEKMAGGSGSSVSEAYTVEKVERVSGENGGAVTRLSGTALPNALATVYLYSEPLVVVVQTDKYGHWTYDLDKELGNGNHEAYVATTDNEGNITAGSKATTFTKSDRAVTITSNDVKSVEQPVEMNAATIGSLSIFGWSPMVSDGIVVIVVISLLTLGIVSVRYFLKKRTV